MERGQLTRHLGVVTQRRRCALSEGLQAKVDEFEDETAVDKAVGRVQPTVNCQHTAVKILHALQASIGQE